MNGIDPTPWQEHPDRATPVSVVEDVAVNGGSERRGRPFLAIARTSDRALLPTRESLVREVRREFVLWTADVLAVVRGWERGRDRGAMALVRLRAARRTRNYDREHQDHGR
jgi:hypothetical protein